MDENKDFQNTEGKDEKPTPAPEKPKNNKEKGHVFKNGVRKIGNGVNWCVDKVAKHPRTAIVVLSTLGTVCGYFLKAAVDILRAPDEVDAPIETEFVDSETDDNPEATEDNSTEE